MAKKFDLSLRHCAGLMVIVLAVVLSGCGGAVENAAPANASSSSAFKVAMVLPGPADDGSWSQIGYEGLLLVEKELGAEIDYTANAEEMSETETEQVFRQYAEQGYDFIIGHGGQYVAPIEKVAEEFPRAKFGLVGGYEGNNKNFGALSFRHDETGYLAGMVAGLKTKSNKVAYIGGVPFPHTEAEAVALERGAKAVNPDVDIFIEWVGNWTDKEKGKELAQAQIAAGTDVLIANVNNVGDEVIKEAKSAGIYAIGWNKDQHDLAPETVLTSPLQNTSALLLKGATLVQQGRWEGKQYKFGLQEGVQDLAPFYGLLTPEEEVMINSAKEEIVAGKIDVTN